MNIPKFIIVHCSDSSWGSAREIKKWHLQRGFQDIGYHFVIMNGIPATSMVLPILNGSIELGRPIEQEGAHCIGYNDKSIGICGIAKASWTESQIVSLVVLIRSLQEKYKIPTVNVLGHCETQSGRAEGKTCPNLDMNRIRNLIDRKEVKHD